MARADRSRSNSGSSIRGARATELALLAGLGVLAALSFLQPQLVQQWMPPCLVTTVLGIEECWGCGMTRAVLACLHGDFSAAWAYNPRFVVVVPLIAYACLRLAARVLRPLVRPLSPGRAA